MFGYLKQFGRVATRYDKTALSFASFLSLAAIRKWLPHFVKAAQVRIEPRLTAKIYHQNRVASGAEQTNYLIISSEYGGEGGCSILAGLGSMVASSSDERLNCRFRQPQPG